MDELSIYTSFENWFDVGQIWRRGIVWVADCTGGRTNDLRGSFMIDRLLGSWY